MPDSVGLSQQHADAASDANGTLGALTVKAPEAGQRVDIDIVPGQPLVFDFNPLDAKAGVGPGIFTLDFPNHGQLVFNGVDDSQWARQPGIVQLPDGNALSLTDLFHTAGLASIAPAAGPHGADPHGSGFGEETGDRTLAIPPALAQANADLPPPLSPNPDTLAANPDNADQDPPGPAPAIPQQALAAWAPVPDQLAAAPDALPPPAPLAVTPLDQQLALLPPLSGDPGTDVIPPAADSAALWPPAQNGIVEEPLAALPQVAQSNDPAGPAPLPPFDIAPAPPPSLAQLDGRLPSNFNPLVGNFGSAPSLSGNFEPGVLFAPFTPGGVGDGHFVQGIDPFVFEDGRLLLTNGVANLGLHGDIPAGEPFNILLLTLNTHPAFTIAFSVSPGAVADDQVEAATGGLVFPAPTTVSVAAVDGVAAPAGGFLTLTDSFGTLVVNDATGAYTFTLNESATGAVEHVRAGTTALDSFTFTITDGHGDSGSAVLTISASAAGEPVTAIAATATLVDDQTVSATGVLSAAGDADDAVAIGAISGGTGTVTTIANAGVLTLTDSFGTLLVNEASGAYTFTLNESATGAAEHLRAGTTALDTFTFTAVDGHGDAATSTLRISVSAAAEPVQATLAALSVADDTHSAATGSVVTGSDEAVSVTAVNGTAASTNGIVTVSDRFGTLVVNEATGAYTFTLNESGTGAVEALKAGATALDSFIFTVADGHGDTGAATLHVTVSAPAEAVSASASAVTVIDEKADTGTGTFAASGDDPVSLTAVNGMAVAAGGTLTVTDIFGTLVVNQATGAYTFT